MIVHPYLVALLAILGIAVCGWLISVARNDMSFVDSIWSLFFLVAAGLFVLEAQPLSPRGTLVLGLIAIWAVRLSVYVTARNWGRAEDFRYQAIRSKNEPGFAFKSLYIVFGPQALLAWLIAFPLLPAITSNAPLSALDGAALLLWITGFVFEAGSDYQLARFRARPDNKGKVLDTGLWRYTRHPNYFGGFCIWWSFYLFAVASGGWWSIASPLLMSVLLLRVSGVAMLEDTIAARRPAYVHYIRSTNAFFPGPTRTFKFFEEAKS